MLFNNNQDEVEIIRPDNRVTNGVIHVIDEVMFIDDLNAKEIVGRASMLGISPILLFILVLSALLFPNKS